MSIQDLEVCIFYIKKNQFTLNAFIERNQLRPICLIRLSRHYSRHSNRDITGLNIFPITFSKRIEFSIQLLTKLHYKFHSFI